MIFLADETVEEIKRRTLCRIGLHVGHPESVGGWMTFYCTRCDTYTDPISPERTQAISREIAEEHDMEYHRDLDDEEDWDR